ncbi:hypothetical protein A33M_2473 [Rhodovulum sp. PH10]|nr:hypothetical protein A33M_2473 [Rhodovulum sp. PH10]
MDCLLVFTSPRMRGEVGARANASAPGEGAFGLSVARDGSGLVVRDTALGCSSPQGERRQAAPSRL